MLPKTSNYLAFQSFDFERTWRRLFWAYLTMVILSVPDEGYSERTWRRLFWAYLTKVILSVPDEGYSERTWWRLFWACWWRLFQKHVVCTTFYIYVFILRTSLNNFDMLSQHCEIPSGIVELSLFLTMLFKPFGFLAHTDF